MDSIRLSLPKPKALLHELEAELPAYSPEELVRIGNEQFGAAGQTQLVLEPAREGANLVREHQCHYFVGALQLFELRREAVLRQGEMTTRPATHSRAAECSTRESPAPKAPVPAYSPTWNWRHCLGVTGSSPYDRSPSASLEAWHHPKVGAYIKLSTLRGLVHLQPRWMTHSLQRHLSSSDTFPPATHFLQRHLSSSGTFPPATHFSSSDKYDILAIQEPWRNPFKATTYHPLKGHFHLTYLDDDATRVCFYINKRIDPGSWNVSCISKDIISLSIRSPDSSRNIDIFNVYNEVGTDTLATLAESLGGLGHLTETVILGDFSLHHPLWSSTHRRLGDGPNAQQLLTIIEDFQLELLTEPGVPTHRWKDGESTIDLTFASEDLVSRTIQCKIDRRLDCDSDHLPIGVALEWEWKAEPRTKKRLWSKTNMPILRQTVKDRLPVLYDTMVLTDKADIDALVSSIVEALDAGVDASTPWSDPSPRSIPGFDQECKEICAEVQRLRRQWQRTNLDDDYEAYRQARNKKGRHIQKLLRNTHRQRVEDATSTTNGLWKLVKWAKNRHETSLACTPALAKPNGELVHLPEEKAQVLRQSFFPPPLQADLSDINNYQVLPAALQKAITVVLRKQGKEKGDDAHPKAYRPIALLNTLGKILEAIVASRLAYLADVHQLLPSRHTGGRKLASTEHAIHLLLQRIYQAWFEGKVASLLLLDVSGAYDNVSRERLLHNLRKRRISETIVGWVASFLSGRCTTLKLQEYTAPSVPI
ncbi:hypothetical protein PCL_10441 [Purpureocillium lilacinum]|uniref:Reverse transcriptase domain-containing protein n=1 Tax=Purpureocillium lilacinum TaxID=33203 RepID=A0A2U3DQD0_PURLI|nr:hypothetical protein PCL_10441 [Purpureocillium lilacinum]